MEVRGIGIASKLHPSPTLQEHYLPHVIRSKVKLACSGRDDPDFSRFLEEALADAHHSSLLEAEFPAELALYSILKDDLDRARYYSNISLQAFLRVSIIMLHMICIGWSCDNHVIWNWLFVPVM